MYGILLKKRFLGDVDRKLTKMYWDVSPYKMYGDTMKKV